ncbi:MAG: aminotransferase class IV [Chloroflexi bacterium]|nr:aminotransferase class IV [Chloroflexota bacterium]MCZ6866852.1 aminotransferase class IV [Chloroflexota bacterium]
MAEEFIAYFNGDWIPMDDCKLSMDDRGFRVGDAVFEVDRTFDGAIFDLEGHMDRLFRSLKYTRMDPGLTREELTQITLEAVDRNKHLIAEGGDMNVRQVITRGRGLSVTDKVPATVYVAAYPLNFKRFAPLYDEGCHVVFARTRSYHPDSLDPKVKHQSRMNFVLAELEASDVDPNSWPVLLDLDGNISEGTGFNFWVVTNGTLRTSGDRAILQGVSRKAILELADTLGIPVVLEDIQLYDAYTADEAFVSGTSHCLLPVYKLDNRPIEGEVPGPIVKQLLAAWSEKVGVDIVGQAQSQAGLDS